MSDEVDPGPERAPDQVAAMFDRIAPRYDLLNDLMSLGQDRLWRRAVVREGDARPGDRVLDLAAGTGTSSLPLGRHGGYVVPVDFSLGMLSAGRRINPELPFVAGDALRLPFADGSFDVTTISFGLRNTADLDVALAEMLRVTRPGGRLVVCEFSRPVFAPFRAVYTGYLRRVLPALGRRVGTAAEPYTYLGESILAWPDQRRLAARIAGAGWERVGWRNLTGGVVALHRGWRPPTG